MTVSPSSASSLWAITSFFNPSGAQSRTRNYRVFRERLNVPLVAVELSFQESFELLSGDAEVLVQLHGRDIMWQKERLLNIALSHLPASCEQVAWLDCDVVFERSSWAEETRRLLDQVHLLQPFEVVHDLGRQETPNSHRCTSFCSTKSFAAAYGPGEERVVEACRLPGGRGTMGFTFGLAWASRRSLLEELAFYDAQILGAADRAMVSAVVDCCDAHVLTSNLNAPQRRHYLDWAGPFGERIDRRVGYVPGGILHLWHGDLKSRGHERRYRNFVPYGFDPANDIEIGETGAWQWATPKPEMHRYVRDYMLSRKEDG